MNKYRLGATTLKVHSSRLFAPVLRAPAAPQKTVMKRSLTTRTWSAHAPPLGIDRIEYIISVFDKHERFRENPFVGQSQIPGNVRKVHVNLTHLLRSRATFSTRLTFSLSISVPRFIPVERILRNRVTCVKISNN